MEIGIIGGGASGLTAAWLLQEHHNVTVVEKQNRLGGHAHTVDIAVDGKLVPIDAGFDFFTARLWPTFYRLLNLLDVGIHRYPGTTTLYTPDNRHVYPMPALRDGGICWPLFKPRSLSKMIQFQRALQLAKPLVEASDSSVTVEQFTEGLRLSRSFKDEFCYPILQALWSVDRENLRNFSAYNGLKYLVLCETGNFSQFYFYEVIGGSRAYIDALAKSLSRVNIKSPVDIRRVTRRSGRHVVELAGGGHYEFDHLILATNAPEAHALIAELDDSEILRSDLSKFEYFKSTIAIHGDKRLMPTNEKLWSVFNIRHEGDSSALTIWKKWKSETPIFKSWVSYEPHLPEPLYFTTSYEHPKVSPAYFEAQRRLAALQGRNNLWLAGLYNHDIDSHESAILSAVNMARRLNPQSQNLKRLMGE